MLNNVEIVGSILYVGKLWYVCRAGRIDWRAPYFSRLEAIQALADQAERDAPYPIGGTA